MAFNQAKARKPPFNRIVKRSNGNMVRFNGAWPSTDQAIPRMGHPLVPTDGASISKSQERETQPTSDDTISIMEVLKKVENSDQLTAEDLEKLEVHYKHLHDQLQMLNELEQIEKMTTGEIDSPQNLEPGEIVSDDDELINLRLQALKSSKPKRKEASVSPVVFTDAPASPDEIQDKLFDNDDMSIDSPDSSVHFEETEPREIKLSRTPTPTSDGAKSSDDEIEKDESPDELREQLLRAMMLKKMSKAKAQQPNVNGVTVQSKAAHRRPLVSRESLDRLEVISIPSPKVPSTSAKADSPNSVLSTATNKKPTEPKKAIPSLPPYKVKPLIIHFTNSSDESEEEQTSAATSKPTLEPQVDAALDQFIKQARIESQLQIQSSAARIIKKTRHSKIYQRQPLPQKAKPNQPSFATVLKNLSEGAQAEYRKLRERLERQEKLNNLESRQKEYLRQKAIIPAKTNKLTALKLKQNRKQQQFTEAQKRFREAFEAYQAAERIMKQATTELNSAKFEVKKFSAEFNNDKINLVKLEQECRKLGQELKGSEYQVPNLTTIQAAAAEEIARKRKTSESTPQKLPRKKSFTDKTASPTKLPLQASGASKLPEKQMSTASISKSNGDDSTAPPIAKADDPKGQKKSMFEEQLAMLAKRNAAIGSVIRKLPLKRKPLPKAIGQRPVKRRRSAAAYESVLNHLHSYRLRKDSEKDLMNNCYANNVVPGEIICPYDLMGSCTDASCSMQHKSKYLLDSNEKVVDVLLHDPAVTKIGDLDSVDYETQRKRLLEFTERFLEEPTSTPDQLLKLIKNSDKIRQADLVTLSRALPTVVPTEFKQLPMEISGDSEGASAQLLTASKLAMLNEQMELDGLIQSRYYDSEESACKQELLTELENNPLETQLWLKLAYVELANDSLPKNKRLEEALRVLCKAIDFNRDDEELWGHYLYLYKNAHFREGCPRFLDICKRAFEVCPTTRLGKIYLTQAKSIEEKFHQPTDK